MEPVSSAFHGVKHLCLQCHGDTKIQRSGMQVSEEESGALGPEWPAALALAGLQRQAAELGRALAQGPPTLSQTPDRGSSASPDAAAGAAAARGAALARALLAASTAAAHLAAAAGFAPEAAEAAHWLQQATARSTLM